MTTTEVCEYIMDLDKKYQQACSDRQEAWEIFQDILRDDAAVKGEGWLVPKDRIDAWIKKVPVMSSSRCVRTVFKIAEEDYKCPVCGKTATDLPEGLKKYYMGCAECFNPYLNPNLSEQLRGKI